ncbi:MAG: hypothetical protein PHT88_01510 [Candidatus Moranbacteria bacterium]|nr:hypothetical protein [Candidatus Moranbacteria bacterium]
MLLGPFDPLKLIFNVINSLLAKGILSIEDAKKIIKESLDPNMPDIEKDKYIESLFRNSNAKKG